jgi:hypothetical protein
MYGSGPWLPLEMKQKYQERATVYLEVVHSSKNNLSKNSKNNLQQSSIFRKMSKKFNSTHHAEGLVNPKVREQIFGY